LLIDPQLDGVFIHVSNMSRAISWYSRLLDLPSLEATHEDMIYNLPVKSGPQIILDAYPKETSPRGTGPRVMFATSDIHAARARATDLFQETTDIQDIGGSLTIYLEDPDGNLICIRQAK
jgi:predicted enzyme related to lactoylglutathione lyase